jgi:hypothetical protein
LLNNCTIALLVQSILLIISQLILLSICLHYAPLDTSYMGISPVDSVGPGRGNVEDRAEALALDAEADENADADADAEPEWEVRLSSTGGLSKALTGGGFKRPFNFWQWEAYGSYLEFVAVLIIVLGVLQIVLGRWMWCVSSRCPLICVSKTLEQH